MFEVDQGMGSQRPAPSAPSLEPSLGFAPDHHSFSTTAHAPHRAPSYNTLDRNTLSRRTAVWIVFAVMLGAVGLWCRLSFMPVAGSSGLRAQLDGIARLTGFGIDMVVLTGHRFTTDSDIFDALDLPNARSLVSFDTEGVRQRLERLPWVESADLTRVFPDRLDVKVSERKAFAVWIREDHAFLIDASGRVLSAIGHGKGLDLPRLSGEGAAPEAERFLTILARTPDLYARLEEAERVGDRRWTLHLTGGVTVHLPPDREAAVLETLAKGGRLASLLDIENRIVDLRASGRVAVRDGGQRPVTRGVSAAPVTPDGFGHLARPDVPAGSG